MDYSITSLWNTLFQILAAGRADWGGLHPVLVHFPIALLFAAPLYILLGIAFKNNAKSYFINAVLLLALGTSSLYLATSTGEKAAELVKPTPEILATLEAHDHLAHQTRLYFTLLTVVFTLYIVLYPFLVNKNNLHKHRIFWIICLLVHTYCLLYLINTAHQGGKLVHDHGIRSTFFQDPKPPK